MVVKTSTNVQIIYDGECPFCSSYVRLLKLREDNFNVELVDARRNNRLVKMMLDSGYDLNEGMIVRINEFIFHGAKAMTAIALMTTEINKINKINKWVFKSSQRAKYIYPILKAGRNFVLLIRGKKQFQPPDINKIDLV